VAAHGTRTTSAPVSEASCSSRRVRPDPSTPTTTVTGAGAPAGPAVVTLADPRLFQARRQSGIAVVVPIDVPRCGMGLPSVRAVIVLTGCSALALAGCGGGSAPATEPLSVSGSVSAPVSTSASASTGASSAAARSATAPQLVLEPDGLGLLVEASSVRHLPFGTDVVAVTTALDTTLGTMVRTTQTECGQGPRLQLSRDGFSALFDGVSFVGWHDSGRIRPPLTTAAGIGVGSTLASVRSVIADVTVTTDTLGPEWTAGELGLGGLLDGTAATSKVTQIYAGETCFFR
jgi:hypothetical protein